MQSVSEADMRIRPALRLGEPFCMVVQPAYQRETIGNVNLKKRQTGMRPQAQHTSQVQPARPQPAARKICGHYTPESAESTVLQECFSGNCVCRENML